MTTTEHNSKQSYSLKFKVNTCTFHNKNWYLSVLTASHYITTVLSLTDSLCEVMAFLYKTRHLWMRNVTIPKFWSKERGSVNKHNGGKSERQKHINGVREWNEGSLGLAENGSAGTLAYFVLGWDNTNISMETILHSPKEFYYSRFFFFIK